MRKLTPNLVVFLLIVLTISLPSFQAGNTNPVAGGAGGHSISDGGSFRWGLSTVNAKEAWDVTHGSEEVVVAVIDSGIDANLPALEGKMWNKGQDGAYGYDFREDKPLISPPSNLHYHGTFVAGLLASGYDETTGTGGVSPNISIMDLRFLDEDGKFNISDWGKLADAVDYASDNGADIINMSLYAGLKPPDYVQEAVERAESKGILVVGIAGNDGGKIGYFGEWDETFTVGSINRSKRVSHFSNYGSTVDLVAPGERVLSFKPGGKTVTGSGTSFAAPHVAGTAALILSKNPQIGLSELKQILLESSRDIGKSGKDNSAGYGVIDAKESLE